MARLLLCLVHTHHERKRSHGQNDEHKRGDSPPRHDEGFRTARVADASAKQSIAGDIERVARLADDNAQRITESGELARYLEQLAVRPEERLLRYRYE